MREFLACRGDGRDGEKTILEFVGSNAQTIEVNETPDEISRSISVGFIESSVADFGNRNRRSVGRFANGRCASDWHALAWSREIRPENAFAPRLASEPSSFA
ncbi:hypothetical protein ACF1BQ_032870 [Bradyrhizobium sp. RDT10]